MLSISLAGRTAVITGAGRGIGRAIAAVLAEAGAAVVVNDLDAAAATETAAELTGKGFRAIGIPGDVTSSDFPEILISTAWRQFGTSPVT